jgi:hypothetical protein
MRTPPERPSLRQDNIISHIYQQMHNNKFKNHWRRMEKISWTDHVRNEEVLLRVNEQRNILHEIKNGRLIGLVISYVETAF